MQHYLNKKNKKQKTFTYHFHLFLHSNHHHLRIRNRKLLRMKNHYLPVLFQILSDFLVILPDHPALLREILNFQINLIDSQIFEYI